jgi:hypothetical protein
MLSSGIDVFRWEEARAAVMIARYWDVLQLPLHPVEREV